MMGEWDNDWDVAATREQLGLSHAADLTETAGGSIGSPWAATWAHASGATAAATAPRCRRRRRRRRHGCGGRSWDGS